MFQAFIYKSGTRRRVGRSGFGISVWDCAGICRSCQRRARSRQWQKAGIRPCSNCHLIGTGDQRQANADVPSFPEIANKEGQTAGSIMAHIVLPKHPMPSIPLTQAELADLSAYILTLRESR
jgi:mono/diheme cytochrome c family protein